MLAQNSGKSSEFESTWVKKMSEPKAISAHGVSFDYAQGRFSIAFGCHLTSLTMKACLAKKGTAEERSFVGMTPERQWSTMNGRSRIPLGTTQQA